MKLAMLINAHITSANSLLKILRNSKVSQTDKNKDGNENCFTLWNKETLKII